MIPPAAERTRLEVLFTFCFLWLVSMMMASWDDVPDEELLLVP